MSIYIQYQDGTKAKYEDSFPSSGVRSGGVPHHQSDILYIEVDCETAEKIMNHFGGIPTCDNCINYIRWYGDAICSFIVYNYYFQDVYKNDN